MKKNTLLLALFLLALSGLLLHYRIHNFIVTDKLHPDISVFDGTRFFAALFGLIDVIVVTVLFTSRKTFVYGYLLNGLLVIYGTVFMLHFSLAEMSAKSVPFLAMLARSTLPDICVLWADFLVGKALFDLYMKNQA